ncbi:cysteine desulfurase family protein [Neobacillus sp. PS3-12]|jgi:cysteine desulfurase|uniref:cysteine desulfurase family protein n=1 Tax=Neobacillus sp. PS3-12 TaxID=3070677 RepID=UPI0027E00831|nr:cysteine desulfurase family protein [Neobacillus sp. PS3-12]WML54313.1 cysteine desulfurase family protein [Neobacillus sp. PS3-12]
MIYFDNSATTKPYPEVLDSFIKVSNEYYGNPSSLHGLGGRSEQLLTQARAQIASILKVNPSEIYFTSGGTESNNLAVKGTAFMHKNRGKHLITTKIEHPSISNAMEQLEQMGFAVTYLPVDQYGVVRVEDVEKAIRPDTILLSIMYVNNEIGTIQPINEIGKLLKKFPKVIFHVDAVQAVGKMTIDLKEMGVDLFSVSAHKFHGLKGVGALFIKDGVKLSSLNSGGNQENNIRSGTENVAGAVSMAKALRISNEKIQKKSKSLQEIQKTLVKRLSEISGITIHTSPERAVSYILNFSVAWMNAETFIHALELEGIYASTTSACSSKRKTPSKTLLAMGVSDQLAQSAIRVSLSFENTLEEVLTFIEVVKKMANQYGKVRM